MASPHSRRWCFDRQVQRCHDGGPIQFQCHLQRSVQGKPDGKKTEKVIVSVKGGQALNPAMLKDLIVTVDQEGAKMGVFLTLKAPTKGMVTQAASAGFYKTDYGNFPKIQIITIEQLFGPANPLHLPWQDTSVFKKAKRETTETQSKLDL
ncbi:MAG TPA: hypothetical protein VIE66_17295 [Methylocella sp.]